jgi:hypothetical protein
MLIEPATIADLAVLLARAYLRLNSRRISADGGHRGHKSADSGQDSLDVPGDVRDESSLVNGRRST